MENSSGPLDNALLSSLPRATFEALAPHLATVDLPHGLVIEQPGREVEQVYFPLSGMLSLLVVMNDGVAIETAIVGREGVVGAMAGLGLHRSEIRVVVQLPMSVAMIPAPQLRKIAEDHAGVRDLCVRFNEVLLTQARITAACNALHTIEARFCRWLLHAADHASGPVIPLRQDFMASMLAVQRTSVSSVAHKIQSSGAISYSRGSMEIKDRGALLQMTCECYGRLAKTS